MASGPNLPPQAYTREMLTAAFNWLQTQPESVRKMATTPDTLVGIFSRAKRFGNSSADADAPVSSQNFMSDLKNLAEGLREFEEPKETPTKRPFNAHGFHPSMSTSAATPTPATPSKSSADGAFIQQTLANGFSTASVNSAVNSSSGPLHSPPFNTPPNAAAFSPMHAASTAATSSSSVSHAASTPSSAMTSGLNERSRIMIQEVKNSLNLSSDAEAVNMMVAVAYKNLKNLLA